MRHIGLNTTEENNEQSPEFLKISWFTESIKARKPVEIQDHHRLLRNTQEEVCTFIMFGNDMNLIQVFYVYCKLNLLTGTFKQIVQWINNFVIVYQICVILNSPKSLKKLMTCLKL